MRQQLVNGTASALADLQCYTGKGVGGVGGVGDVTRTICESAEYIESKIMIVLAC